MQALIIHIVPNDTLDMSAVCRGRLIISLLPFDGADDREPLEALQL